MTNKRKKENKFNINKMMENKLYIAIGIIILFVLILVISFNVSNEEQEVQQNIEQSKAIFVEMKNTIELKVANLMLDGSVTDNNSMEEKIEDINNLLENERWDKLGIIYNEEIKGNWSLDESGMVKFKFESKDVEPSWIVDTDIKEYIIKN